MKKFYLPQQLIIFLHQARHLKTCAATLLLCMLLLTVAINGRAQSINLTGPAGSGTFGVGVTVLANGNYVIIDPVYDEGAVLNVGAVYLYNGSNHTLISTLKGSSFNDQVGSGGIYAVGSSNFLVRSTGWNNGAAAVAGAVTWVNGTTGLSGVVNSSNSLVGSTAADNVGNVGVGILTNGNYVVVSSGWDNGAAGNAGAATWGNGNSGVSGIISSSNSLVGNKTDDNVGGSGILVLTNGNYVIRSTAWSSGTIPDAGAVTWGNGTTGTTGVVSASNSLVGSTANDEIGSAAVALTNGNYVTSSFSWNNGAITNAGAATWGNGTTGITGVVSSSNSLVGSTASDQIASIIVVLNNGNYVLQSSSWDNGGIVDAGAATWCNGTTGRTGTISSANSFIGAIASDRVSFGNITALNNGHYVVRSSLFDNGAIVNAGAMTWCNGTTGRTGVINSSNSLTSNMPSDQIGNSIIQLTNGNYVVCSFDWDNGAAANAGAATWCSGTAGTTGAISSSNSLVGSQLNDQVGLNGAVALSNGNYVVPSQSWNNGAATDAGAATWGNGSTGITGVVSSSNSLVGTQAIDFVGNAVTGLTNGNYVVRSGNWKNGAAIVGAATWGNGTTGINGAVSTANSLVGSTNSDNIGSAGITVLTNGNYVVCSPNWDNGGNINVGAATWGNGSTGIAGLVSSSNSLTGAVAGDQFPFNTATALTNGNYVLRSALADNGAITDAGAVAWSNGTVGTTGVINSGNAFMGSSIADNVGLTAITTLGNGNYIIRSNNYDDAAVNSGAVSFGNGSAGLSGVVTSCNSVLGTIAGGGIQMLPVYNPVYDYTIVRRPNDNIVTIFIPTNIALANSLDSVSITLNGTTPVPLIANTGCRLIATLTANGGATAIKDSVHSKVWIEAAVPSFAMLPFVARHYEITPRNNATTATGRLTVYFTQPELNDFNAHPNSFWNLPANPGDATGKSHVRIAQYEGTSSNRSGLPGSYTPGAVIIDPNDADIVWNSSFSRWEISFDATGFGGFILQSALYPLAVSLQFNGQLQNNDALLTWKTANEAGVDTYVLERSVDGSSYSAIYGSTAFNTNGHHQYNFNDKQINRLNAAVVYYRIKQVNIDGSYSYSQVIPLSPAGKNMVLLYPNPAADVVNLMITVSKAQQISCRVIDNTGRIVSTQKQQLVAGSNSTPVNVSSLAPGMYWIELAGELMQERRSFIKR